MNIEQDYIDLFSCTRKGHMAKYVHMVRPYIYEEAIQEEAYYPFKMECELLDEKADYICRRFQGVIQALEIGPGSSMPIMHKTVPLLRSLAHYSSFSIYRALDSNLEYAEQACQIVKEQFQPIRTEALEVDFLTAKGLEKININAKDENNKLLFSFGQVIFGNNDDEDTCRFLHNIGKVLGKGDYLLCGLDTNRDRNMLEASYNTKVVHELLLNTMYYLKNELNLKDFKPEKFNTIYRWNEQESTVEHYLKPTLNQTLKIQGQELTINKGQEYNILNSRKLDINKVKFLLDKEKLEIKEIITSSNSQKNKFSLIVAQKIKSTKMRNNYK